MKHRVAGRKLGRTSAHRLALLRNLSAALIEHERITTTLIKAKELRRFAEKLVTLSKRETLHARRRALQRVPNRRAVAKLFDTLSARYSQRAGGYTRILKLGPRRGDHAEMALIEFVPAEGVAAAAGGAAGPAAKGRAGKLRRARKGPEAEEAAEATTGKAEKGQAKGTKGAAKAAKKATERKAGSRKAEAPERGGGPKRTGTRRRKTGD